MYFQISSIIIQRIIRMLNKIIKLDIDLFLTFSSNIPYIEKLDKMYVNVFFFFERDFLYYQLHP